MRYDGRTLDVKYEQTCFAYGLDVMSEDSKFIYASGNYNDTYRLDKEESKLYCNKEFLGSVDHYVIF
jgi:hypothetical protein